jgi:20S proteasome subunit alpha 7
MNSGADLDASIFSSEGRVIQIEYAGKAIENSSTVIGICCRDGVVVGAEKLFHSRMIEPQSSQRCYAVDFQAGVCIAGMVPDGRQVMQRARDECENARTTYGVPMDGATLARRIGDFMHMFTKYGAIRPFGCSVLLASYGDDGPQLFQVDPSGTIAGYHACAAGKGKAVAKASLEAIDFSTITCAEAVKKVAEILYDVHDSTKDKIYEIELAWVCEASKRRFVLVPKDKIPPKPADKP